MGVLWTHDKECKQSLETRRDKEQILLKEEGGHADTSISDFQLCILKCKRVKVYCLSQQGCKSWLQWPRK